MTEIPLSRAEELLEAVRRVRILVLGDLMLDRYLRGSVERISPEAPVPVVRIEEEWWAAGGAANVAANVLALGASCTVAGCVGPDPAGEILLRRLEEMGGAVDGVIVDPGRPTTTKTRVMARNQQVVRFDLEEDGELAPEVEARLAGGLDRLVAAVDVVVLEDYNKGVLSREVIGAALSTAAARGLPTVVDPKRRNFFAFRGVTVFKPNAKELEEALGERLAPQDEGWVEATRSRLGCRALLLTLGDRGMVLGEEGHPPLQIPAVARSVYDVSGAGDTVTALAACILGAGGNLAEAAILANHAAAIEVGKVGVATVAPEELLEHLRTHGAR